MVRADGVVSVLVLAGSFGFAVETPASGTQTAGRTALDDYVAAPDPSYRWVLRKTAVEPDYKGYILDMISQTWRTPQEVNRTEWQHWVTVVVPEGVTTDTAILVIESGSNGGAVPAQVDPIIATVAVATQSVIVYLQMVPNEPLRFADESFSRTEDGIIAYTWDKFLRTGDPTWPVQLPMVKSAVRAMDAAQEFLASAEGGGVVLRRFVVGGGSKRGWATWLTAAVDPRVIAIVPVVIDVLNVEKNFIHHFASYGFWAPAVGDYTRMGIMDWVGTPQMAALMDIVDPYVYRDRFTMPKYLVNATGDQFFRPDSSQFYWDDLPGEKHLRYVPNADHSMIGGGLETVIDAATSVAAYYTSLVNGAPRPRFSWTNESDGSIRVRTIDTPTAVRLWQASNPTSRDFRLEKIGKAWTSTDLTDQGGGVFVGRVCQPQQGFVAFMVELQFDSGWLYPFTYSTQVRILPEPATLSVRANVAEWGTVLVEPNLARYYDPNTVVTLTPQPAGGFVFVGWTGDVAATETIGESLRITMDRDRSVQAMFVPVNDVDPNHIQWRLGPDGEWHSCGAGTSMPLATLLALYGLMIGQARRR